MLASITPLGERARHRKWSVTLPAYVIGSLAGGAAMGGTAGLVGMGIGATARPGRNVVVAVAAVLAAAAVAIDTRAGGLVLPTFQRQVDETWLHRYRGYAYGFGFGAQLGFGVATVVSSASVYLVAALAVLSGSLGWGLAVGALFGLARGLPLALTARVTTPARLEGFHALVRAGRPWAERLTVAAEAGVFLAAAAAFGKGY